jgi:FAD:protein FMN transferase
MFFESYHRVMGTTAHIVVVGDERLLHRAIARLDDLERRWSRFLPDSEISRMNAHAGEHVVVSAETFGLISCAIEGWHRTEGLFDPTVLMAVCGAGYDRDFGAVAAHASAMTPVAQPAPGCGDIVFDDRLLAVTVPPDVGIDPGGIGKGLAADLVASELVAEGAHGVLVNVGGDLRVIGEPPNERTWEVAIDDPARDETEVLRVGLLEGAVATSSRVRRRWTTGAGPAHHLIDPRTGAPGAERYATAAAVTGEAWWAEVATKAVLIGGLDRPARRFLDALIVTVTDDGTVEIDPQLEVVAA